MSCKQIVALVLAAVVLIAIAVSAAYDHLLIRPATIDDLGRSLVLTYVPSDTVYTAGGQGILITETYSGVTRHFVLTAGHAIKNIAKSCLAADKHDIKIGFLGESETNGLALTNKDLRKEVYGNPCMGVSKNTSLDLGWFVLCSNELANAASIGSRFGCIDIGGLTNGVHSLSRRNDERILPGAGIALRKDYGRIGIAEGGELTILSYMQENGMDGNLPLITNITSSILHFDQKIQAIDGIKAGHIIRGAAQDGQSGSPVFAYTKIHGRRYPVLIGIVTGVIPGKEDESFMTPIDDFVEELRETPQ